MKKAIVIISVCVICVIIMLNGVSFITSLDKGTQPFVVCDG